MQPIAPVDASPILSFGSPIAGSVRGESEPSIRAANAKGKYATSVARPALFREYLANSWSIWSRLSGRGQRRASASEIPYPYVLDGSGIDLGEVTTAELSRWFPSTELVAYRRRDRRRRLGLRSIATRPLALFDGPRTDFSLARLKHYTGTAAEHFQRFVLFTNYVRYVDEFVRFAIDALRARTAAFTGLSVPGGDITSAAT